MRGLVALSVGGYAVGCSTEPEPPRQSVGRMSELQIGVPHPFVDAEGVPAFVVKLGTPAEQGIGPDADIVAFHQACPHMGCPMPIEKVEAGELTQACVCHFSKFSLIHLGRPVDGPATQGLTRVVLELEDDELYVVGRVGTTVGVPASASAVA